MLKTLSLFALLQLVCTGFFAQSALHLVASAGNTDSTSSVRINWSLGEVVTSAAYTPECTLVVAEGFQQAGPAGEYDCPFDYVEVEDRPGDSPAIKIYPNPVASRLSIQSDAPWKGSVSATVCNAFGQVLLSTSLNKNPAVLDLQSLPPAWYYLTLTDESGWQYTLKLVKQ